MKKVSTPRLRGVKEGTYMEVAHREVFEKGRGSVGNEEAHQPGG